ncbi:hypothetical protein KAT67_07990 [candidate division WOR-3 bacterium]|nr:hypothetical protein [candidate division WOR-3 bacterium]
MIKKLCAIGITLLLMVVLTGCGEETDEEVIESLIMSDTIWFNANTTVDSTSTSSSASRDTTIVWWRGVQTHNDPTIEINIVGDSAWVSWQRSNYGDLYSLAKWDTLPWVLWTKQLSETAQICATFLRTGTTSDENRGWQIHSISLAYGESDSVNTVRIDSLRIESLSYPDLVIDDPLNTFYRVDSLLTFTSGESVTLTLYTNVIDGYAFLHSFILAWPYYVRLPFTNLGEGVYQGTWNAQIIAVPRFAIFDLLSNSTLYTSEDIYDFNGWLLPYTISE